MRRVFAISLAILIVMTTTSAVMAQDGEQSVSDRLLEILKERQIISNDEYGELQGLATEMKAEQAELNERLGDLDRSITEYLAKDDAALGSNVTYQVGNGFTFATQDGMFSLTIGGMFRMWYQGVNRDRNPFGCGDTCGPSGPSGPNGPGDDPQTQQQAPPPQDGQDGQDGQGPPQKQTLDRRDVNNFWLDNRFHFQGHAFDPSLTFYFEFMAGSSVGLFEGWVNYNVCDWFNVRGGLQRVPTGRQALIHQSDLSFGNRAFESIDNFGVNAGYAVPRVRDTAKALSDQGSKDSRWGFDSSINVRQDIGVSIWNLYEGLFDTMGDEGFALEYIAGIYNGDLASINNWVSPAFRLAIHPFGYVPLAEGDWTSSGNPGFALGVNYGSDVGVPHQDQKTTFYSWDAVLVWSGLYLTGEWHLDTYKGSRVKTSGFDQTSSKMKQRSWFVQAGFMVMPQELELMVRYAKRGSPNGRNEYDNTEEWVFGVAYYFEGHHLKGIAEIGQQKSKSNSPTLDDPEIGFFRLTFQLEW